MIMRQINIYYEIINGICVNSFTQNSISLKLLLNDQYESRVSYTDLFITKIIIIYLRTLVNRKYNRSYDYALLT